jgi:translation initiation factor IF-2
MEQRRLRLGDIVDDYCPRERRVTNHAVVAMIEEDIRQTRCTTCDTEHIYKGGSAPRPRRKHTETVTASPPASNTDVDGGTNVSGGSNAEEAPVRDVDPEAPAAPGDEPVPSRRPAAATPDEDGPVKRDETGPVRRPLIRATLPRPEGQPTARPAPEFTIRQPGLRGGYPDRGRGARGMGGNGQPFSTRPGKGGGRPGGGAPGRFDRGGRPQHGGRPQGGRRSDKKRSR